jgi:hypothetical protein
VANEKSDCDKKVRPAFDAFVIITDGDDAFWTMIGAAWPHDDGRGFNLQLLAMPFSGRIALREPKEREAKSGAPKERNAAGK